MPRASIIVPAYNAARTLPETLDSLRAQSFADFEVLIVDDGSSDATPAIARRAAADPRFRYIRQANRGLAGARNTGIAEARGEYVGFCDADDLWRAGKLGCHVAHLDAAPAVGLSYSGSDLIDAQSRPTGHAQRPRLTGVSAAHVFLRNPVGNGSAAVMRRAALEAIAFAPPGGDDRPWVFDETFRQSEDVECWLRLALTTGWRIEGVSGLLTAYRVNPTGLSADTERQRQSWEAVVAKLRPLAPEFFARHEPAARAYQLRYLARRAVSALDAGEALSLVVRALATSPRPLWEEPGKTLTTAAAALLLRAGAAPALRRASPLFRARLTPASQGDLSQ